MSSLVELICLANSEKKQERCIAGIDRKTEEWIRPVSSRPNGEVPFDFRNINGSEPEILDIIQMTLEYSGETYGFQTENRLIVDTPWRRIGRTSIDDVLQYCCTDSHIFFTEGEHIPYSQIRANDNWKCSLQLWETHDFKVHDDGLKWDKSTKWRGSFTIKSGLRLTLTIKDIDFENKINAGETYSSHCLVLVSLGVPFLPRRWTEKHCWKLIATVIEI